MRLPMARTIPRNVGKPFWQPGSGINDPKNKMTAKMQIIKDLPNKNSPLPETRSTKTG
jgi:hypothetical protein